MSIPVLEVWDCRVRRFDGWTLEIIGGQSSSLETAPRVIIRFSGVSYIECPMEFSHPQIRYATDDERKAIGNRETIEEDDELYVIEAESGGSLDSQKFYIIATALVVEHVEQSIPPDARGNAGQ